MSMESTRNKPGDKTREHTPSVALPASQLHLVIVGGGSAAFSAMLKARELGATVTLINDGLPLGGTCVNVGCIPSKTLIRAAEAHHRANHHHFQGVESTSEVRDFRAIISQKDELVGRLRRAKYLDLLPDLDGVTVIEGRASFAGPDAVSVNGETIRADRVIIATGARPFIPDIPGLEATGYLTSTTAMELDELPRSLVILGGRYVALELGQMFSRLGTKMTILQRSDRILPSEAPDVTGALTSYLADEGMEIVTGVAVDAVDRVQEGVGVTATVRGETKDFFGEHVLVATGRAPNTDGLGLAEAGVQSNGRGAVLVDDYLETSAPGVYAVGDVIGEYAYVYTAAYEGALAAENAILGNTRARAYTAIPWVVFTDPQVAGVGMDEAEAAERGFEVEAAVLPLDSVPRALAARDTRGFVKLIRDARSDFLLGARILAPEGGELIMEASLAIKYKIPVSDLAGAFHPYLTMSEAIKLAAITFGKDVSKLSCCAS